MNNTSATDHSIIEYVLSTMSMSGEDFDALGASDGSRLPGDSHSFRAWHIQTSYLIKKFIDEIPGGFFIYRADENETILYANQAMLRIFNCSTMEEFRELTGNSFKGIVHPEDLEDVECSIKEQIEHSQYDLDYVEYRIIQKGGAIRWLDDYGHFVRSDSFGDVFYVFVGDATDKKKNQMEEFNKRHFQRLKVIEGLGTDYDSIYYVDLDKNIIQPYRLSHRMADLFREKKETYEFAGFDAAYIGKWVHPDDRNIVSKATNPDYIRKKLSRSQNFFINYRIINDEKTRHLELHVVNVGSREPVSQIVLGYRSIDDKIIEKMEQQEMLEYALNQSKSANIAKDTFLANMSHDIRTPMNAIVGFTALARNHLDDREKLQGYLDMIETSSNQLLQLLNNVLEISRIESGKTRIENARCSLIDIMHEVHTTMLPRAASKNISLLLDISRLKHDTIYSDAEKLTHTLLRLTNNAVKYTENGGKVTIAVTEANEPVNGCAKYLFTVKDNGIGIGDAFLEHIFEPFEREKNTTLSGVHGTGLGLTIAKNVVEMMGGTIDVQSNAGQGSCFTITISLPIQNAAPAASPADVSISSLPESPRRILIVEDTEINLEIETALLEDAGFLVDTATDGSIAVEKVKTSQPGYYSLILMDIQMPIMNGYLATEAIRSLENPELASIPILALSANTFEEDKRKSKKSGMNAHLGKPINTPELLDMIRKALQDADKKV